MVPRAPMQATKNRVMLAAMGFAALVLLLAGCTPPGPRALLAGRRLLEDGHYPQAVEQLTLATKLMATNAQAWNYLGLARHQTGDASGAVTAYQQALRLDRELFEAHYNLGCLRLDQGRPDAAKGEFTACVLRKADAVEAWLRLGTAQYRLAELATAEESFRKAWGLSPNHPEALNGLGLVHVQRRRPREAAQFFREALKQRADYRPALLNLATVLHRDLNDPAAAAQKFHEYLALLPRATDWDAVNAVLQDIETKPVVVSRVVATNPPPHIATITNGVKSPPPSGSAPNSAPSNPLPVISKPAPAPAAVEVVKLPPGPTVHAPPASVLTSPPPVAAAARPEVVTAPVKSSPPPTTEKRGFFSRLNPFRSNPKPATKVTLLSGADPVAEPTASNAPPEPAVSSAPRSLSRYTYLVPTPPAAGNRSEAEAAVRRGAEARGANKLAEATAAFQQAVSADGSYFEGYFQLALSQHASRDYSQALAAWETALALRPEAAEARYGFALTLKAAGFAPDAAAELEKVVAANANDARAHLVLGNLYAEPLRDKTRARVHYQRTLEIDPRQPQATQIRYWLVANPA